MLRLPHPVVSRCREPVAWPVSKCLNSIMRLGSQLGNQDWLSKSSSKTCLADLAEVEANLQIRLGSSDISEDLRCPGRLRQNDIVSGEARADSADHNLELRCRNFPYLAEPLALSQY